MKRQYRFVKGYLAGSIVTALVVAVTTVVVVASAPEELSYRAQQTEQFRVPPPDGPIAERVALAPYVEGWKDGVPFAQLPDNTVPEPGTLVLLLIAFVVWFGLGLLTTRIFGPRDPKP